MQSCDVQRAGLRLCLHDLECTQDDDCWWGSACTGLDDLGRRHCETIPCGASGGYDCEARGMGGCTADGTCGCQSDAECTQSQTCIM